MISSPKVGPSDYPFEPRYLELDGGRMHYVDEGEGPAVVLVHGTPTWSYLYRHLIKALATDWRVVAPDHLGFGRSDKPDSGDYRPATLAANLERLIARLGLRDIVLVVHDFGGPIGLSHAIRRPAEVRGLVLFNTWMWSLAGTRAGRAGKMLGGALGRLLYTRTNFSPRVLVKAAFGDRRKLTPEIHRRYLEPFDEPSRRVAPWVMARELSASAEWFERLWHDRSRLTDKPALLLWGMKDPAFGGEALERWRGLWPAARAVEFPGAGHFVQEEEPVTVEREVRAFLSGL